MISHPTKTSYRLEYWKTADLGGGVTYVLVPKQTYEYTEPNPFKDSIISLIKDHDLSYKIIEVTERLVEE
jgi:hypothetical protein